MSERCCGRCKHWDRDYPHDEDAICVRDGYAPSYDLRHFDEWCEKFEARVAAREDDE